jgi:hypothetical protein
VGLRWRFLAFLAARFYDLSKAVINGHRDAAHLSRWVDHTLYHLAELSRRLLRLEHHPATNVDMVLVSIKEDDQECAIKAASIGTDILQL